MARTMKRKMMRRVIRIWARSSATRLTSMTWTTTFSRREVILKTQASSNVVIPIVKEGITHPASAAVTAQAITILSLIKSQMQHRRLLLMSQSKQIKMKKKRRKFSNNAEKRRKGIVPLIIKRTCKFRAILQTWWARMLRVNARKLEVSKSAITMWAVEIMTLHQICLASCPETLRRRDCVEEATNDSSPSSRRTKTISKIFKQNLIRSRKS